MTGQSWLPELLREFALLTDTTTALAIADVVGGQRVYIPAGAEDGHWLVKAAGRTAAEKIMAAYAGRRIDVPLGPQAGLRGRTARMFSELRARNASASEMARALGMTERGVMKKRAKARDAQAADLPLFPRNQSPRG